MTIAADSDATLEGVRATFVEILNSDPAAIVPEATPEQVPGWDSLAHVNIATALEERFGVSFEIEDLMQMESIGAIVQVIERIKT